MLLSWQVLCGPKGPFLAITGGYGANSRAHRRADQAALASQG